MFASDARLTSYPLSNLSGMKTPLLLFYKKDSRLSLIDSYLSRLTHVPISIAITVSKWMQYFAEHGLSHMPIFGVRRWRNLDLKVGEV